MDKNQVIGIVLIVVILFAYSIYMAPTEEERNEMQRKRDSANQARTEQLRTDSLRNVNDSLQFVEEKKLPVSDTTYNDSLKNIEFENELGIFSKTGKGKQEFITISNKNVEIKISTLGGYPYYVNLPEFKKFDGDSLILFDKDENVFGINLYVDKREIKTNELFFKPVRGKKIYNADDTEQSFALRLDAGSGKYIEYIYTLKPESYLLDFKINIVGLENNIPNNRNYLDIIWNSKSRKKEKGADWENQNTTIYYKYYKDKVDYLTETSDNEEEKKDTRIKWIAYKDHFFSSVLIADEYLESAEMKYVKDEAQLHYIKYFESEMQINYSHSSNESVDFTYYFGPNDYDILKEISVKENDDLQIKEMIPLGWAIFRWVNQLVVIPLFNLLGSFISNYGLLILVMTVIIKLVLFPLTYKSYASSAKMRVLKPQIDELNKKIPADKKMERQQATMALYRKAGVNPMGGCLPMLIQMPILIAMFRFFPASIELRQKSFLWADDLSSYDSIWDFPGGFSIPMYGDHISLFTLLMAGAMLVSQLLNKNQMSGAGGQIPGMKMMLYMMPVMMLLWFNNYSSGLSYYYFLSNVITIGQTLIIRKMINEDDVLAKLNANKKKKIKKSKMQMRLEKMQKMQKKNTKKKR